jgi:hypothetical protein
VRNKRVKGKNGGPRGKNINGGNPLNLFKIGETVRQVMKTNKIHYLELFKRPPLESPLRTPWVAPLPSIKILKYQQEKGGELEGLT